MSHCRIRPIPLVEYATDKSLSTYKRNFGKSITKTCYVWYIEGIKEKILVDAGSTAKHYSERGTPAKDVQLLDEGLNRLGVHAEDIEKVILTHLHPDHITLANRFINATFLVQTDEIEFARNPHPSVAWYYLTEYFDNLHFEVLNGDTPINDKLSVLKTPGHSPGGQSVVVETERGRVVISGICSIRENFEPSRVAQDTAHIIPPGLFVNLFDVYDSMLKIKDTADIVVALHDEAYGKMSRIP